MKLGMNMTSLKLETIFFLNSYHQFEKIKNINESLVYLESEAGSTVHYCNMTTENRNSGKRGGGHW
jgi:citrate lyase synthetase